MYHEMAHSREAEMSRSGQPINDTNVNVEGKTKPMKRIQTTEKNRTERKKVSFSASSFSCAKIQ